MNVNHEYTVTEGGTKQRIISTTPPLRASVTFITLGFLLNVLETACCVQTYGKRQMVI